MSIAFDPSYYLLQYPDVAAAVVRGQFPNAYTHFVLHGARELRNPNAQFNAVEYAGMYPDVANAVAAGTITNVWDHYVTFGISENRAPSLALKDFDPVSYLAIHTDVAAAVTAGAFKSAIDHYLLNGQAEHRTWGEDKQLTNGTDKAVANKFVAGLVYNPGGTDRINSLQDEDELTGIGVNPTLTATLGNANDNGGTTITPILKDIQTVNVAFTGSGDKRVDILDLQDSRGLTKAVNITRITDELSKGVTIRNLTSVPAELSVSNTHSPAAAVNFTFLASATAGTTDVTQLTLSNAQIGALAVEANSTAPGNGINGIETINLVSKGAPNVVGTFTAQDLQTLNITGDQNLTLTSQNQVRTENDAELVEAVIFTGGLKNVAGSLSKIDGSTATGNLTLNLGGIFNAVKDGTSGTNIAVDVLGGKGNDTFIVSDSLNSNDKIDGGEGSNTLILANATANLKVEGTVAKVQALDIRTGDAAAAVGPHTITVDASKLTDLATVIVRNEGSQPATAPRTYNIAQAETATVNLNKLAASVAEGAGIVIKHGTTGNNDIASLTVNADPATDGTNDKIVYTIAEGVNVDPRFNVTLSSLKYETVTLKNDDSEDNSVQFGVVLDKALVPTNVFGVSEKLVLTGATSGKFLNLDTSLGDTSGVGIYGYDTTGKGAASAGTTDLSVTNKATYQATAGIADVFQTKEIDASGEAANVIIRVGSYEGQKITLGSGNDTLVFDAHKDRSGNLSTESAHAGLTHSDSIVGGAGTDTLVIDGEHTSAITLQHSEWQNVKGFDQIYLVGNGGSATDAVTGFTYNYRLDITDGLIDSTDGGEVITIRNDANGTGTTTPTDAHEGNRNSALLLDLTAVNVTTNKVKYDGSEGANNNNVHVILDDASFAGQHTIDGGDTDVTSVTTAANGNDNSLELRDGGSVTIADFANLSNFATLHVNNATAASNVTAVINLNNATLDRLADTSSKVSATSRETFSVFDHGNAAGGNAVTLNLREVTENFNLNLDFTRDTKASDTLNITLSADTAYTVNFDGGGSTASDKVVVYGTAPGLLVRANSATLATNDLTYQLEDTTGTIAGQQSVFTNVDEFDFSNATFNGTLAKLDFNATGYTTALNVKTGAGSAFVIGSNLSDTITLGTGADTVGFNNTGVAVTSGMAVASDKIVGFNVASDKLAFGSTFLNDNAYGSGNVSVTSSGLSVGDSDKIFVHTSTFSGAATAADVATFANAFSAAGNQDAVLLLTNGANTYVWYVNDNLDATATDVTVNDVKLLGVLEGVTTSGFTAANFAAAF